jgi:hypothetical protein
MLLLPFFVVSSPSSLSLLPSAEDDPQNSRRIISVLGGGCGPRLLFPIMEECDVWVLRFLFVAVVVQSPKE